MQTIKEILSYNLNNKLKIKGIDTTEMLRNYKTFLKYKKIYKEEKPITIKNIEKLIENVKKPKNTFFAPPIALSFSNVDDLILNDYLIISILLEQIAKLIKYSVHKVNMIEFTSASEPLNGDSEITLAKILILDLTPIIYKKSLADKELYMQSLIKFINKRQSISLITFIGINEEVLEEFQDSPIIYKYLTKNIFHYIDKNETIK